LEEAKQLQRDAINISQQLGDQSSLAYRKGALANTLLWHGKFEEAHQMSSESLTICQDVGFRLHEDRMRCTLSATLLHMGKYQQARQQADHAFTLHKENRVIGEPVLYCLFGELALVESSYVEAQEAFAEGARISREVRLRLNSIGLTFAGLGYAACLLGQLSQAQHHLAEALGNAVATKSFLTAVYVLPGVGLFLVATGATERAVEVWALAQCHPFVANSKWFEDVAGRELEVMVSSLPVEVAEAARERGRTLDLWETAEALRAELTN
jgi:tetratricopeptide (TPR) repeat protein